LENRDPDERERAPLNEYAYIAAKRRGEEHEQLALDA
jgi:hypothetical protein